MQPPHRSPRPRRRRRALDELEPPSLSPAPSPAPSTPCASRSACRPAWLVVALLVMALLLASACAGSAEGQSRAAVGERGGDAAPAGSAPGAGNAMPRTWHAVMEDVVGPSYELVMLVEAKRDAADMDLPKIARAARDAAQVMQLGYGRLEQPDIPGFADMARDTERWLRAIAASADAGRAAQARAAIRDGEAQHCIACHDAAERAGKRSR